MIRDKFYKKITDRIDEHQRFECSDFTIEPFSDSRNESITLTIIYNIEPKYNITFNMPSKTTSDDKGYNTYYSFSGTVSPGPLAYEETFSFKGENGVYEKITTWLNCIWEELCSNPIVKQVEKQKQQIDEIFEKFEDIKDEFFSEEEAKDIKKRLDELEKSLKDQILKSDEDKKILEEEIETLHIDIDTLKQTVQSFKKKGWFKSFTTKVFKWTKDSENRKMLSDGFSLVKAFLPEEVKSSLP